jgi:SAM-dependent methyltransferase
MQDQKRNVCFLGHLPWDSCTGGRVALRRGLDKGTHRLFGTRVQICNTTVDNAGLQDKSLDRAFSISVIEHLPRSDAENVMRHVYRVLKPGGLFVITLDLFLNLHPFTSRATNYYGMNQDVRWLLGVTPWEVLVGKRNELFGFEEFNADAVLGRLEEYLVGNYPTLVQCLVLRQPAD